MSRILSRRYNFALSSINERGVLFALNKAFAQAFSLFKGILIKLVEITELSPIPPDTTHGSSLYYASNIDRLSPSYHEGKAKTSNADK